MACIQIPDVKLFIYILVILFGMGSWVSVNGLWVELPILVDQSPESWNLPSYMTILVQIANIGPLAYVILNKLLPEKVQEKHGLFVLIIIGSSAALLLIVFWKETSYLGGFKSSTGLHLAVFLLSLVDCTSSVIFLPYMTLFKPQYISGLYIGEGLSGLVPGLVALGQGGGETVCKNMTVRYNQTDNITTIIPEFHQPNFSAEYFFFFLLSIMIICGLAFALLQYLPFCREEHISHDIDIIADIKFVNGDSASYRYAEIEDCESDTVDSSCDVSYVSESPLLTNKTHFTVYLVLMGTISALMNGIIPNIQTYASVPYGTKSYHLAVTLSNIVKPLACVLAFFLPLMTMKVIVGSISIGIATSVYIITMAANSPAPPMVQETIGAFLIVLMFVLLSATMSFSRVSIASVLRLYGRQALIWCGIVIQVGAFIGAMIMFAINRRRMLHRYYPCA